MPPTQDLDIAIFQQLQIATADILSREDKPQTAAELMTRVKQRYPTLIFPEVRGFEELKEEASERVLKIWEHWTRLHNILERREDTMRRRWTKKTAEQRKKVLLTAWPDMPVSHRPDMQALHRETREQRLESTEFRDAFLFPQINLEDLTQQKPLLLLLNSRGHNLPHKFATNELKSARVGFNSGAIPQRVFFGYKMILEDQKTPQTYGQLRSSIGDTTGGDMESGDGIMVLEIQQRLLRFLEVCTELILHDLPLDDMSIPVQPAAPFDKNPGWPSLAHARAEAPYLLPDACDFGCLLGFIHAKCAESMDHMWSLREDPKYFHEVVNEWSMHQNQVAFNAEGKGLSVAGEAVAWNKAVRNGLASAYGNLLLWNYALNEFSKLCVTGTRDGVYSQDNKSKVEASHIEHDHFSYLLTKMRVWLLGNLKTGVFASPPLRDHYIRDSEGPDNTGIRLRQRCVRPRDPLLDLIDELTDWTMVSRWGLHNLLDELERIVQSDKKQRKRISPWVTHILSDLTVVAELERQMSLYQRSPGAKMFYKGLTEEMLEEEYLRRTWMISGLTNEMRTMKFTNGVAPLRKCCYPSDRQPTAQRAKEMINAETVLDALWTQVDKHFSAKTRGKLHEVTRFLFPKANWDRESQRTPEWHQPVPAPTQGRPYEATIEAYSALDREFRTQLTISTDEATPSKKKIKTRGEATNSDEAAIEILIPTPDTSDTPATISVHKRAYKTLTALFHLPNTDELPGEISWLDFLQAMTSAGFAVHKLDGSAWIFRPQDNVQRGIIFHEPHPHSRIPFHMARRHGRRLQRAYGWTGETFVRA
ncbi:MAG: hypothetical protein LQ347_003935 [Umbilicaria vellea]|nr:MAG: hypothetical protein LQ347_003935 [Umbilicaria vellea]